MANAELTRASGKEPAVAPLPQGIMVVTKERGRFHAAGPAREVQNVTFARLLQVVVLALLTGGAGAALIHWLLHMS